MNIKVFWLEPDPERVRVSLRRFSFGADVACQAPPPGSRPGRGCDAVALVAKNAARTDWPESNGDHPDAVPHDDPRWPTTCENCGRLFTEQDQWQVNAHRLHRAPDGRYFTLQDATPGAMWGASWMPNAFHGPDGICLVVRLPNGHDWMVDSEASNCTRKGEKHQCWVRHGDPRTGDVHVDKNGDTCSAGAGSIQSGDWHGFLHHGELHT